MYKNRQIKIAQILLVGFSHSAISQKVNFSGISQVDSLKSNVGHFVVPVTLKIVQNTIPSASERHTTDVLVILFPLHTNYPLMAKR
jgi:hypothetical protein